MISKLAVTALCCLPLTAVTIGAPRIPQSAIPVSERAAFTSSNSALLQTVNIIYQRDENGNLIKEDPRGALTVKGPQLGMSASEIRQARMTTGYVTCPGTTFGNPAQGSGALIGDGGEIITAAHIFIDEQGRKREPLADCYFQNETVPWTKLPLAFAEDNYRINTTHPSTDVGNDFALVRLTRRLAGATPFDVDTSGLPITVGTGVLMISATQDRFKKPIPRTEPIVQSCTVQSVYPANQSRGSELLSDCSSTPHASGSIMLARMNGKLVVKGIVIGSGPPAHDFQGYSRSSESYAVSIGVDSQNIKEIINFEAK